MRLSNLGVKLNHALLFVLMIALGFAAMRSGSKLLATILLYGVYFILVVGTILGLSPGRNRGAWVAFAAFGWAYFLPIFVFGSEQRIAQTPTDLGLMACSSRLFAKPQSLAGFETVSSDWPMITINAPRGSGVTNAYFTEVSKYNQKISQSVNIGHFWLVLIFASLSYFVFQQLNRGKRRRKTQQSLSRNVNE